MSLLVLIYASPSLLPPTQRKATRIETGHDAQRTPSGADHVQPTTAKAVQSKEERSGKER